ncbi:MAG: hypothetical protein PHE17_06810 [Thiothrix sp.]|uniref:hypothetical protein n=1 Tax=Thiothrix sp. TaxID=1032 RepID=UPI00260E62CA|nr:hypothetical protein [Thiothrix sp.]MDD5392714.1 hypothetical protein [Thiothrix sp.]
MKTRPVWLKVLLYLWVAPITLWCLPLAWLAKWTGGGFAVHTGVLEVWGGKVGAWLDRGLPVFGAVNAFTLGHLVVGISPAHLECSRVHERTHVAQFERWGVLFPLIYALAGLRVQRQGKHRYWDNPYEIEARAAACLAVQQATPPE